MDHLQFTPSETETDYVAVPLRRRDGSVRAWTLVDLEDLPAVKTHRWCLYGRYVGRNTDYYDSHGNRGAILLHREILGLPRRSDGREGDHINRNRLDNRRSNLRVVTHAENGQNMSGNHNSYSGLRGVGWYKKLGKWAARLAVNGERMHLGLFDSKEEARVAVRNARKLHMPFSTEEEP